MKIKKVEFEETSIPFSVSEHKDVDYDGNQYTYTSYGIDASNLNLPSVDDIPFEYIYVILFATNGKEQSSWQIKVRDDKPVSQQIEDIRKGILGNPYWKNCAIDWRFRKLFKDGSFVIIANVQTGLEPWREVE